MKPGDVLAERLKKLPELKADLDALKKAFPGVRLKWVKFADGTEIGKADEFSH